jgi:hypothetical protein
MEYTPSIMALHPDDLSYANASRAVVSLTAAWHCVLRVPGHDKAAESIELPGKSGTASG